MTMMRIALFYRLFFIRIFQIVSDMHAISSGILIRKENVSLFPHPKIIVLALYRCIYKRRPNQYILIKDDTIVKYSIEYYDYYNRCSIVIIMGHSSNIPNHGLEGDSLYYPKQQQYEGSQHAKSQRCRSYILHL